MDANQELREKLVLFCRIATREGLFKAFGHVSARVPNTGTFLMQGRRAPALVTPTDFCVMDPDGNVIEGNAWPAAEHWIHGRIYKARPDVSSIIHNHAPMGILLSIVGETVRTVHHTGMRFADGVPLFEGLGLVDTLELGDQLAVTLSSHKATLMRGHGATVVGPTVETCCLNALALEEAAWMQVHAMSIGTPRYYTDQEKGYLVPRMSAAVSGGEGIARAWEYYRALVAGTMHADT
ncbi:MAG: class II aldolase/adducin family protein [Chloroflexi bacterium]|nr:class II aldolase/adducin family protein [Chloroflexota bacterium]